MRREYDALLSLQRFVAGVLPAPWEVVTELESGIDPQRPFVLVEQSGPAVPSPGPPHAQEVAIPYTVNLYLPRPDDGTRESAEMAALDVREQVWQAVKWGPDVRRPTTDRIPLWAYDPRCERHRFNVVAAGGTYVVHLGVVTSAPVAASASASVLAAALASALGVDSDDVVGYQRGTSLIDIVYTGALAGVTIGAPMLDPTGLVSPTVATVKVKLQGAMPPWRTASDFMRVASFQQSTISDAAEPELMQVAVDLRLTFVRGLPLPLNQGILQRVYATSGSGPEA